jgi:uncharacterized membrane protein
VPRTPRAEHYRREVSRVEGFSDAVFAFAITLLVVSLEVPKTYHELMAVIRGFPSFAIGFALLFQVWWRHYQFFRRYDLEDSHVITLTGVLLFVVVFYTYPLKFVWMLAFSTLEGRRITDEVITLAQVPTLFLVYGAGVVAVFTILALMYGHAYRVRDALDLTAEERLTTRTQIYSNVGIALVGVASMITAVVCGRVAPTLVGIAGYAYALIGLVEWGLGEYRGRELKKLRASTASTPPA